MIGVYTHVVVRHGVPDRAALGGDELVAALVDDAYAHLTLVPLLPEAPGRKKKNTRKVQCICGSCLIAEGTFIHDVLKFFHVLSRLCLL